MWARRFFAARGWCRQSKRLICPTSNYHGCEGSAFSLLMPRFVHNSKPWFGTKSFLEQKDPETLDDLPFLFPTLRDAFSQLADAELKQDSEGNSFLMLPDALKWMWEYRVDLPADIYKRDCYDGLLSFITEHLKEQRGVVVTGTPGIGKTGFLWYLLWSSLKSRRDVVLALWDMYFVLRWKGNHLELKMPGHIYRVVDDFAGSCPWLLADKVVPEKSRAFPFKFVLSCSPRKSSAGELRKGGGVREVYVPTWSEEELCRLNRRVFRLNDEEVRKRFFVWGGVPRFVLDEVSPADQEHLQKAIFVTSQQDVKNLRFSADLIAPVIPEHLSHKIFHCNPVGDDFTRVRHFPASRYVIERLLKELPDRVLEAFLHEPAHEQLLDLQSAMWEKYILSYLELGGQLQTRTLAGRKAMVTLPAAKAALMARAASVPVIRKGGKLWKYDKQEQKATGDPIPDPGKDATFGIEVVVLPDAFSDDLPDTLITATSRNNSVWDAIRGNTMFQITVRNAREPVKLNSFQMKETFRFMDMVRGAGCERELVYVVPRHVFPTFSVRSTGGLGVKVATIPAKVSSLSELFGEFLSKAISRHK